MLQQNTVIDLNVALLLLPLSRKLQCLEKRLLMDVHNLLPSLMAEAHILMEVPASLEKIQRKLEGTASEDEGLDVWTIC